MAPTANKINSIPFTTVNRFRIVLLSFLISRIKKYNNDSEKSKSLSTSLLKKI